MKISITDTSTTYIAQIQPYVSAGKIRYEMKWIDADLLESLADLRESEEIDRYQDREENW